MKDTDKNLFHFDKEVLFHFSFLKEKGFSCRDHNESFVRFESLFIFINIYHGRMSYEIGLEIEDVNCNAVYALSELLRITDNATADSYRKYSATTAQAVAKGVEQLAEIFCRCVRTGVLEDDKLFSRLRKQREILANKLSIETRLDEARRQSEIAWKNKRFDEFIDALSPFQKHLSLVEIKKITYAKKVNERNSGNP